MEFDETKTELMSFCILKSKFLLANFSVHNIFRKRKDFLQGDKLQNHRV